MLVQLQPTLIFPKTGVNYVRINNEANFYSTQHMNQDREENAASLDNLLAKNFSEIWHLAEQHHQDTLFLLSLLRNLETIHRKIRTEMFELSLPHTRNDLYQLVKDIEEKGGWPYIERMRLRDILINLESERHQQ